MEELRKRLSEKRLTNVDAQGLGHELWFVPSPAINQIVDKTAISSIADATNLPIDKDRDFAALIRKDLKKDIHDKAKVTFAISCYVNPHCLRHIQRLICHGDNKESKNIDRLLPLSKSTLSKCGFDTHDADLFFKAQWHFIAPKIQLGTLSSKHFPQERILPFQAVEEDGMPPPETGAFGKVVKLHVTPGHQEEPPYNGTLLRKQFKAEKGAKASPEKDFCKELRNLAILSSARHENIIQLLLAYVQGESFNFIFPLASHGNLNELFQGNAPWTANEVVFALSGLTSALVVMHQFATGGLHLIGCHRDLKPANILVHGKRLLLADFGLSRFVDSKERSTSTAPNVNDDFIAPEHLGKDFSLGRIGRSSDIWAFGCVTLMFLVYLLRGKEGVGQLRRQRRTEPWAQYAHHYFHNWDTPNSGLEEPFEQLHSDRSASTQGLLYLVKEMLVLQKDERPKATMIDSHMRSLAIHLSSTNVEKEFEEACKGGYVHVRFERARLEGWRATIININESSFPEFRGYYANTSYSDFKIVLEHLQELHKMLLGFNRGDLDQDQRAFLPVRSRIDHLWGTLDEEGRKSAVACTDSMLTNRSEVLRELEVYSKWTSDKRTEGKAIVKRQILDPSRKGHLEVDFSCLRPEPLRDNMIKTRIMTEAGPESDLIIAEETKSSGWFQDLVPSLYPEQVSSRLLEIANLLATSADQEPFKVLHCRGYYCSSRERRSGLLYQLPSAKNVRQEHMFTLHEILDRHKSGSSGWFLGERFRLAHSLASAVYELHSVSWLHRNLSASTIVFFCEKEGDLVNSEAFYLTGFAQSRPDVDFTFTDGPTSISDKDEYYEHPDHLSKKRGYQMPHDYYALGMLLLEIGIWNLLPNAVPDWDSILDKRETVAQKIVPQLGASMGSCYRDAVATCLDGKWGEWATERRQKIPMLFKNEVVERLSDRHCRAW